MRRKLTVSVALLVISLVIYVIFYSYLIAPRKEIKGFIRQLGEENSHNSLGIAGSELIRRREKAIPYLIKALTNPNEDVSVRENICFIAGIMKMQEMVPVLISVLKNDENVRLRMSAITALEDIRDKRAVPVLIDTLSDRQKYVRPVAARALGKIGDKQAIPALISTLTNDEIAMARGYAACALGNLKAQEAVTTLMKSLLRDESGGVRWSAATALGQIGDKEATSALLSALKDKEQTVRVAAAGALYLLEPKDGFLQIVIQGSKAEDYLVRSWTIRTIETLLSQIKIKQAEDTLIAMLNDKDTRIRSKAARSLGELRLKRAVPALVASLKDDDNEVVKASIGALWSIGDLSAIPYLEELLKSEQEDIRGLSKEAIDALKRDNPDYQ